MSDDKRIWDILMEHIGNPYGVAGLMGNLQAESSLNPVCKTGGKGDIRKLSGQDYVQKVMSGEITPEDFAHDGVAFGLAQWCYWSRKEALFKFVRERGLDIGSTEAQVTYMLSELYKYRTVWKTLKEATSIAEASDIVLLRYEKPADTSDKVKAKRQLYGQGFYEKYANAHEITITDMIDTLDTLCWKYKLTATEQNVVRATIEELLKKEG